MKSLKELLGVKDTPAKNDSLNSTNKEVELQSGNDSTPSLLLKNQQTFHEDGYSSSINANGNPTVFKACLQDIFQKYIDSCRKDEELQKQHRTEINQQIESEKTELRKREQFIIQKQDKQESNNLKADELNKQIANPKEFIDDINKRPKAQFYLGIFILIPITLYLFVFYISTFFSAFFKGDAIQNEDIASALFDPNVLSETKSTMELIGLIAVPFVFLGLGYILHMLNRETKKSWPKVVGLYVVAFIFDFILPPLLVLAQR